MTFCPAEPGTSGYVHISTNELDELRGRIGAVESWVGIARDDRTGHHWHAVPGSHLPACINCRRWMTDWSLINPCTS